MNELPEVTDFAVANSLIITGPADLINISWQNYLDAKSVNLLARFENLVVLKVDLVHWELQTAIEKVALLDAVENVQPDMVQLRSEQSSVEAETKLCGNCQTLSKLAPSSSNKESSSLSGNYKRSGQQGRVKIALIDDGFNFQHPALSEVNVIFQYDLESGRLDASATREEEVHGTYGLGALQAKTMNNIKRGLAKEEDIIALRLPSPQISKLVLAIYLARNLAADIIHMSLRLGYLPEPLQRVSQYREAGEFPPLFVVAAGNNGKNACENNKLSLLDNALVIGSRETEDRLAYFSNFGECVDLYGPTIIDSIDGNEPIHFAFSGTSASSIWAAAELSKLIKQDPKLIATVNIEEIIKMIEK